MEGVVFAPDVGEPVRLQLPIGALARWTEARLLDRLQKKLAAKGTPRSRSSRP
jgi:hypothetical protein